MNLSTVRKNARIRELEERVAELEAACRKMAYNWRAHSRFLTIHNYVRHEPDCEASKKACACGATQSVATFKAGRRAIDAAVPPHAPAGVKEPGK
jgi:hypothetical protein